MHADADTGTWNTVKTENGAYTVYALVSGDTGWKYVLSVPQRSIHAETLHNTLPIICVIAFGLIASILLATVFTKYSTRPISLLSGKAMSLVPDAVKDSDDDLEKIEISMLRLHAEKNELNMQLHSQRSILRSYLFACLFYGEKDKLDAFYKILQKDHISLEGKVFRVLAISCHGEESEEEAENEHAMGELVKYALIKILRELIKETGLQGICCDVRGNTIALLLNADSMDESVLNVFVHEFNQRTRLHFGVGITAGVSGEFENLEDTNRYFTEALNALEMRYLRGLNVAIHHEDWKIASASEMNDMNSAASAIAENLIKGAYAECAKGVLEYVSRIKKSNYSAQNAKRMMTMLLVSLQQALRSMPAAQLDLSQLMYLEFETINDVAQELVENIMSCQAETEKEVGGRFDSIATLALDYMKANISLPILSMTMISEACGVSASYVTQAFKGKYATTPMQYLDSIRMEHACTLLRETDLKINDILTACGYVDRANFMRKFKKVNLLTPMEYRKAHKNTLDTGNEQNSNEEGESEE